MTIQEGLQPHIAPPFFTAYSSQWIIMCYFLLVISNSFSSSHRAKLKMIYLQNKFLAIGEGLSGVSPTSAPVATIAFTVDSY